MPGKMPAKSDAARNKSKTKKSEVNARSGASKAANRSTVRTIGATEPPAPRSPGKEAAARRAADKRKGART